MNNLKFETSYIIKCVILLVDGNLEPAAAVNDEVDVNGCLVCPTTIADDCCWLAICCDTDIVDACAVAAAIILLWLELFDCLVKKIQFQKIRQADQFDD